MGLRIWQQSITDLEQLPQYRRTLAAHGRTVCAPDTEVEVHGVRPGTYPDGLTPIEAIAFPWCHRLLSLQIVQGAMEAERQGFDAVAVSCFFDPGLVEARSVVDIPVVSMCETAFQVASAVGRRYGLIGLDSAHAEFLHGLAREYGVSERIAAIVPLHPAVTEADLDAVHGGGGDLAERVASAAEAVAARGADVIIPAEGVLNTALMRQGLRAIGGVPVLDAYGALLAHAEMLVRLRRTTGLATSRVGAYAKSDAAVRDHIAALSTMGLRGEAC
ncbi:MAG TPA: aspartate/glutamate racemase family protein [Actinoplanes sp.]|nr:aspartate/glutamate racemase family protein [Actinoplanes sp.]